MPRITSFSDLTLPATPQGIDVWRWLYQSIRSAIIERRLPPGSRLPSTRELAQQYDVARGTVTAAYAQLLAEGYVSAHVGSGTFVATGLMLHRGPRDGLARLTPRRTVRLSQRAARTAASGFEHKAPSGSGRAFRSYEPALDLFPTELWARTVSRVLRRAPRGLYGHGDAIGYVPLRRAIAEHVGASRGVRCSADQVFVTAGAQHALSLIGRLLLDPGDTAWVEDPGYTAAHHAWRASEAELVHVPVDAEGLRVSVGRATAPRARLAYVTPANQFPLGTTMSAARRLELLDWAATSSAWIVEDDYDGEYRYAGRPAATLQGVDRLGSVIYVGTFTKMLFNAIRLGFIVLPDRLVDPFARSRSLEDRHPPTLDQAALADFIVAGHFGRHVRRMRQVYADRMGLLKDASDRWLRGVLDVMRADAGMRTIGWLNGGRSDRRAADAARARGLEVVPLSAFATRATVRPGLMLGFAGIPPQEIRRGVEVLARALTVRKGHGD